MGLSNWMGWFRRNSQRAELLALQVAVRARDGVWHRTQQQIGGMSVHEARGYARARAAIVVAREAEKAIHQTGRRVRPAQRQRIVEGATAAVVAWIVEHRMAPQGDMARAA